MSNFKFHGTSNFKLIEKFETLNTTDSPFVGDSSDTSDCEYQNSFISAKNINIKKLIRDLSSYFHFKRNKFDVDDYKNSISSRFENYNEKDIKEREIVKNTIKPIQQKVIFEPNKVTNNQLERGIEALNYELLSSDLLINTSKCYLNNTVENNHFEINIDIANKSVSYTYYIYFKDSVEKNDGKPAMILKTGGAELLLFFLEKVYGEVKARKIRHAIWKAFIYQLYDQSSIPSLAFLYDKLPNFIRKGYHTESEKEKKPYKISDELLWKHFKMFVYYDRSSNDASYYVIYIMTLITPLFCMQQFMKNQKFVLDVYENLDDKGIVDEFFGWYDLSRTFSGKTSFEPTNKDVFVTLLNSYVQMFEGNKDVCVFESSGVHYKQGKTTGNGIDDYPYSYESTYKLDSEISLTNEDGNLYKIYLINYVNIEKNYGQSYARNGSVYTRTGSVRGYTVKGYYNPLEIIKFTQYTEQGEAITMNVPAIFMKHFSDVKEWEQIDKIVRFGFNILMIVGSAATIYSGASSIMLYAAITDLGLATGDILVQGKLVKGDYRGEEGQKFLALWDEIYTKVGIVTFSPVAIKLVATSTSKIVWYGADLLQTTGKRVFKQAAYEKVKEFTLKAIHNLEIPNFNKTGLQIIPIEQKIAELKNISKLQKVGVIFVQGGKNTIAAIYKGVAIASGKAKDVYRHLREAIEDIKGTKELQKHLDDLVAEVDEKVITFNFAGKIIRQVGEELDEAIIPQIVNKIRRTTPFKNFEIIVLDRNSERYSRLYKIWQDNPRSYAFFASNLKGQKLSHYRDYTVKGPKIFLFKGESLGEQIIITKHTLLHELFHVEMHARLIDQLGMEKYLALIGKKIPTHIKEEYVVHRLLNAGGKAADSDEIAKEINLINTHYRPNEGLNDVLSREYLKTEWNLKKELKKVGITY